MDSESGLEVHLFFLRYTMQRMVCEGQGPSGTGTKHGGWQWLEEKGKTGIVDSFRTEFGIPPGGDGDPRWYASNSKVKRLGDCWKEAQAIRLACTGASAPEEVREERLCDSGRRYGDMWRFSGLKTTHAVQFTQLHSSNKQSASLF
jgi:hypothetical protein